MRRIGLSLLAIFSFGCSDFGLNALMGFDGTPEASVAESPTEVPHMTDADHDGYIECNGNPDVASCDCDDSSEDVNEDGIVDGFFSHPGATEVCDFKDNDCDGEVDEDLPVIKQWPDKDGDGYGDMHASAALFCKEMDDFTSNNEDCDDTDDEIHPGVYDPPDDGIDSDCSE